MLLKLIGFMAIATISMQSFALEEIVFQCNTKPKGLIKVVRNKTTYKVDVIKNEENIFNYVKDYKKNTKEKFLKFNYSYGHNEVAIGFVIGYFGKDNNSLRTISVDDYVTYSAAYDIDNIKILECVRDNNYINKLREIDKRQLMPAFYWE